MTSTHARLARKLHKEGFSSRHLHSMTKLKHCSCRIREVVSYSTSETLQQWLRDPQDEILPRCSGVLRL
ncbi:hypothetical protein LIA77_04907 [Sarocladium implicatum]|nr:hypothetical protein LIA77_04907 [Sarocladium implicatum]